MIFITLLDLVVNCKSHKIVKIIFNLLGGIDPKIQVGLLLRFIRKWVLREDVKK